LPESFIDASFIDAGVSSHLLKKLEFDTLARCKLYSRQQLRRTGRRRRSGSQKQTEETLTQATV
jgi:hypothetical protein